MRASFVLSGVATGVRRNAAMTVALILSTAIALGFVGAAILANIEIGRFKSTYESKLHVSVYLCTSFAYNNQVTNQKRVHPNETPHTTCTKGEKTTAAQIDSIRAQLKADPRIKSVKFVTEATNLARAVEEQPAYKNVVQPGTYPASFTITLKNIGKDYVAVRATYQNIQGVDQVQNSVGVIKKILNIIDSARWFSIIIAVLVLAASVLLIANTIQVAAAQRRNETSIMRLVGASRWMTELPFMIETIFAVVIGGIVSAVFLSFGKHYVLDNVFKIPVQNGVIPNLGINDVLVAGGSGLLVGVVLAAITALVTLRFYVRL